MRFLFVPVSWRLRMCLMRFLPIGVTVLQCRLKNVLKLLWKEADRILIRYLRKFFWI